MRAPDPELHAGMRGEWSPPKLGVHHGPTQTLTLRQDDACGCEPRGAWDGRDREPPGQHTGGEDLKLRTTD